MNIKNTIATAVLAGAITLTGAQGTFAGAQSANSSETGHITRTERKSASQGAELGGEGEWAFESDSGFDMLMVTRIDFGSESMAEYGVELIIDGDLLEESGFEVDGTFRIQGIDGCEGVIVNAYGMDAYVVACSDDGYVNMIIATDKDVALDTAATMQDGFEPTAPRGYDVYEGEG